MALPVEVRPVEIERVEAVLEFRRRCTACGYLLAVEGADKCSECGRPVRNGGAVFAMPPAGVEAGIRVARPVFLLLAGCGVAFTLYASRLGEYQARVAAVPWVLLGVVAYAHRLFLKWCEWKLHLPQAWTRRCGLVGPWVATCVPVWVAVGLHVPMYASFLVSRSSLERVADEAAVSGKAATVRTSAGLYPVIEAGPYENGVRIIVYADGLDMTGFVRSKKRPGPRSIRLGGDWYFWSM